MRGLDKNRIRNMSRGFRRNLMYRIAIRCDSCEMISVTLQGLCVRDPNVFGVDAAEDVAT